jgi:hypothetical protein
VVGAFDEAQTHVHALHQTHRSLEAFVSDGKKKEKNQEKPRMKRKLYKKI